MSGNARTSRISYPPAVKARALAALLTGDTPGRVAGEYGVPLNTVKSWRRRLKRGEIGPFAPQKKDLGGPLIEHLEASLRSLIAQSEQLAKPGVLEEMRAGNLAVFFGTVSDRTLRMLELAPRHLRRGERAPRGHQGKGNSGVPAGIPGAYRESTESDRVRKELRA